MKSGSVQLRLELEGTCLDGVHTFLWAKPSFVPPKVDIDGTVTLVNMAKLPSTRPEFGVRAGQSALDDLLPHWILARRHIRAGFVGLIHDVLLVGSTDVRLRHAVAQDSGSVVARERRRSSRRRPSVL